MGFTHAPFGLPSGSVPQGGENTDPHGQQARRHKQRENGVAGHQLPHLAHQLYDGVHRGHNGAHAGCNSLTLKPFLLSLSLMVAGPGIEPGAPGSKPGVLPMHYPAVFS